MTVIDICDSRKWACFLPQDSIFYRESDDIYETKRPLGKLYSNQRIAHVNITGGGSWEVYFTLPLDLISLKMNSHLIREYSLYARYITAIKTKWDYISAKIYKVFGKRFFFDELRSITRPIFLVDKMTSKQKRFTKQRILRRSFQAWSNWVHPPAQTGRWSRFPTTGWVVINDLSTYAGVIARSYSPGMIEIQVSRETCFVCKKPAVPKSDSILYYSCGHAIHAECNKSSGIQVHQCQGIARENDILYPFCPLPASSNINPYYGLYVLDRSFHIVGENGKIYHITQTNGRGRTLFLSDVIETVESRVHIWRIARLVSKWRRRAVAMVERQRFSVCYLHIQLMQVAWNEFGHDIRQFQNRLERIPGLKRWREKIGILSTIVLTFCKSCTENTVGDSPFSENKKFIRADMDHFGGVYNSIYKLYAYIYGNNDKAEWFDDLNTYTKPTMFQGLKQKQLNFQVLVREILFYMEEMIARFDLRLSIDRGLDVNMYKLPIWCASFHRIGYSYLNDEAQRATTNFLIQYRLILNEEIGKVRFAFKWNTQQLFYKREKGAFVQGSNSNCNDDLIFQMGEVCGMNIKVMSSSAIHFVCIGMDNLVRLVEQNTKLPIQHWLKQIYL